MRTILVLLCCLVPSAPSSRPDPLTVHEWGTFTSVAGADGATLEWRPLNGASDLPGFVYTTSGEPKGLRHGKICEKCKHTGCACGPKCEGTPTSDNCNCKSCGTVSVRMETPVLYFYTSKEQKVSVKVDFPKGRITEWYPQARDVGKGIDWGAVRIVPGDTAAFPLEKNAGHYYAARETDAAPVRVCAQGGDETEKFLFYRGIGTFDLPLRVTLDGSKVTIANQGPDAVGSVILFEAKGGKIGFRAGPLAARASQTFERPVLDRGVDDIGKALEAALVDSGLYAKEARAMVKTWRDSWFEDGLRVFYLVPRKQTDAILPITITPSPAELVRTLVGRIEVITPELEREIVGQADRLGDASFEVREAATKALRKLGRFAEPVLKRVLKSTSDAEVKSRIQELLK